MAGNGLEGEGRRCVAADRAGGPARQDRHARRDGWLDARQLHGDHRGRPESVEHHGRPKPVPGRHDGHSHPESVRLQRRRWRGYDELHEHADLHGRHPVKTMPPRGLLAPTICAATMLVAAHSAWAGLAAQATPAKLHVVAKAGTPTLREILVTNSGEAPVVVNVHLADWRLDDAGDM